MTIARFQNLIEQEIKKQEFGTTPVSLYEPLRYIMALGGKRLRPLLVLLGYSLFKSNPQRIIPLAIAVEVFHNFTLLHDDIMDKAPLRRGYSTVHERWNVNTAILAGDVMLVKVYELLLNAGASKLPEIIKAFNKCAAEVCEGQQWDMEFETRRTVTEIEYMEMIRLKTAVLLGFSLQFGAMLAGASSKDQRSLREFGINVGLGFQLKDDLLDVFADKNKFGKQIGGDIIANKKTFLLIKALEAAKSADRKALVQWIDKKAFNRKEKVAAVTRIYERLDIQRATQKKIESCFKKAYVSLNRLEGADTSVLVAFTEELRQRQS